MEGQHPRIHRAKVEVDMKAWRQKALVFVGGVVVGFLATATLSLIAIDMGWRSL